MESRLRAWGALGAFEHDCAKRYVHSVLAGRLGAFEESDATLPFLRQHLSEDLLEAITKPDMGPERALLAAVIREIEVA